MLHCYMAFTVAIPYNLLLHLGHITCFDLFIWEQIDLPKNFLQGFNGQLLRRLHIFRAGPDQGMPADTRATG